MILLVLLFAHFLRSEPVNRERLLRFSNRIKQYELDQIRARQLALEKKWPIRHVASGGQVITLQDIEYGKPVYYITHNVMAAHTASTDKVWPDSSLGYSLAGEGLIAGLWDGGAVRLDHDELAGRVTQQDGSEEISSHATHVAGTIIAGGYNPKARGMAYKGLLHAYTNTGDILEMTQAAAEGLKLSNHSYGPMGGWTYNVFGDGRWVWSGDPEISETEDYSFGFYTKRARDWDELAFLRPHYLMVVSSGNDRYEGPGSGAEHWVFNGSDWVLSSAEREWDGIDGYDCINGFAVGKNVLTVGAIKSLNFGYMGPRAVAALYQSSTGPTDDGRIKPDLVADGDNVLSASSYSSSSYSSNSGTSSAAASVTGSLLLIREHYQSLYASHELRASTLKALLIHSAREAGYNAGPDYTCGWGVINTAEAITTITKDHALGGHQLIREVSLMNGGSVDFDVTASGEEPLKATIVWTDPPGPTLDPSLNPKTPILVNDVDLRIDGPHGTSLPWVLNPEQPAEKATRGDNTIDNVEQVLIENPTAGTYTVHISHKGTLTDGPQVVSLILGGIIDHEIAPPAAPHLIEPINKSLVDTSVALLRWQQQPDAISYTIEISKDSLFGALYLSESDMVQSFYTFSNVPANSSLYWRVRAWNAGGWSEYSQTGHFDAGIHATPVIWEKISPPELDFHVRDIKVNPWGYIFAVCEDSIGYSYLYRSTNRGLSWERISWGPERLFFDSQYNLYGESSSIYRYGKEGTITTDYCDPPAGSHISRMFFDSNDQLYALLRDGSIYVSGDLGESWNLFCQVSANYTPEQIQDFKLIDGAIYITTWGHGILRSRDGGTSWESITKDNPNLQFVYTVCGTDDGSLLAGAVSGLYKSDINTINWVEKHNGAIEYAKITDIETGPCGLVYAGNYGCHGSGYGVFMSQDYGDSWILINSGLRHDSPRTIEIAPSGDLYIGIGTGDPGEGGAIYRGDQAMAQLVAKRTWGYSAPDAPIDLVSPESGCVESGDDVLLEWHQQAEACYFRIQISEKADFSEVFYDRQIPNTSLILGDLKDMRTYYWRVCAVNVAGCGPWSEVRSFTTKQMSAVNDENLILPKAFTLYPNKPNPFNPSTTITFDVPLASHVELRVFDMLGREVATLVNERCQPGQHRVTFDAGQLASGLYFYRIRMGDFEQTRKMLLVR